MDYRSEQRLNTVHKNLGILAREVFNKLKKIDSPITFKVTCGLRSEQEQNQLYKTRKSPLDGYEKISKHQTGEAIDILAFYEGEYTFEIKYYYALGMAFLLIAFEKGIKIKWGGFFKRKDGTPFEDGMHIELR
jgi:peptidoglycan L-alanyl-D-glutamate endopeptidase CwlK